MGEGDDGRPAAHYEANHAFAFDHIEAEMPGQRGDRGARAFERGDGIALDRTPESCDIDAGVRQPGAAAKVTDKGSERDRAQPPGQPMPETPVRAIGPDIAQRRKEGIGPGIPSPGGAFRNLDHAACIFRRDGIVRGCAPEEI